MEVVDFVHVTYIHTGSGREVRVADCSKVEPVLKFCELNRPFSMSVVVDTLGHSGVRHTNDNKRRECNRW